MRPICLFVLVAAALLATVSCDSGSPYSKDVEEDISWGALDRFVTSDEAVGAAMQKLMYTFNTELAAASKNGFPSITMSLPSDLLELFEFSIKKAGWSIEIATDLAERHIDYRHSAETNIYIADKPGRILEVRVIPSKETQKMRHSQREVKPRVN